MLTLIGIQVPCKGMDMMQLNRRAFLIGATVCVASPVFPAVSQQADTIHVVKGRGCGCCTVWADILKSEGFQVTQDEVHPADLAKLKIAKNIPPDMASCHTAEIDGYVVEGHVPAVDIRRLIAEKPDALGLAVPGMPYGSPGMGPEDEREAYEVFLIRKDGTSAVFTSYSAAS